MTASTTPKWGGIDRENWRTADCLPLPLGWLHRMDESGRGGHSEVLRDGYQMNVTHTRVNVQSNRKASSRGGWFRDDLSLIGFESTGAADALCAVKSYPRHLRTGSPVRNIETVSTPLYVPRRSGPRYVLLERDR